MTLRLFVSGLVGSGGGIMLDLAGTNLFVTVSAVVVITAVLATIATRPT